MLPSTDIDEVLLNISLVGFWPPSSLQSICVTILSVTLNLIAVILKVVCIAVWSIRIPRLTTLRSLTLRKSV